MTVRGDGAREQTRPAKPPQRMGPSPRSFAADAHGCIMVRPQAGRPHTSSRRDDRAPRDGELPSDRHASPRGEAARPGLRSRRNGDDERLTQTAPYKFARPSSQLPPPAMRDHRADFPLANGSETNTHAPDY